MSTQADYDTAVANILAYIDEEPDPGKRDAAQDALSQLNIKKQEAGFGDMARRTSDLQALTGTLEALIENVSTGGPIAGVISEINDQIVTLKASGGL